MPRFFARKFVCFYCNRRSAQDRKAGVWQWKCEQCDAVNHLDEHGEITDPPIPSPETPLPTRYANPQPSLLSSTTNIPDRSLFCPRCLQNQHIVNQALAEYLPPQDDPTYPEFEYALPGYRKKMEERFPQVCRDCAPAVDDRIRSTGYAAKTDHLRRMMDRTRGQGVVRKSWNLKSLALMFGGVGWTLGSMAQLAFHLLGALPTAEVGDGLVDPDDPQSMLACFVSSAIHLRHRPSCNQYFRAVLAYSLGLSLLCCWWNPKMQFKLRGGYGRIIGRADYYKLQLVALAVRFVSWKFTATDTTLVIDSHNARATHALSLVLETLVNTSQYIIDRRLIALQLYVLSWRSIQIDQRPQVLFQEQYEPLARTQAHLQITPTLPVKPRDLSPGSRSHAQRFPIEKLAPKPVLPQQSPYQPPTPPPEESDEDTGMDWTPQHNFRPAKEYNTLQSQPAFHEPPPFHGTLPPAPVSWAQRLRNPAQPAFHKASDEKKEKFFPRKTKRIVSDDASEMSSQFSPKNQGLMSGVSSPVKFAPPRFFAPADRMETGLESLFEDAFTLNKDSKSSRGEMQHLRPDMEPSSMATSPLTRLVTAVLLCMSCIAWDFATTLSPTLGPAVRSICQLLASLISGLNAVSSAALSPTTRSIGSVLFYGLEATVAATLSGLIWQPWGYGTQLDTSALGLWFLIALTVQEGWDFFSSLLLLSPISTAPQSGTSEPTHQDKVAAAPTKQQRATRSEPRQLPFNQALKANKATAFSTNADSHAIQMSQRGTRSKRRNEVRRDSLGVDGVGSLSLSGW
ncbi:MAG: hypothetical protein Q9169_004061 [Polycauliona sp. 2 TL-2023]